MERNPLDDFEEVDGPPAPWIYWASIAVSVGVWVLIIYLVWG